MSLLPVELAYRLAAQPEQQRWLVEQLWSDQAVGLIGGEPKCCKSFLALDVAVAVAAGTPCLRHFPVSRPGRVLLFAAEDALHVVRQRLEGIARACSTTLQALDIHVITASTVRLDLVDDVARLTNTVATLRPCLLILDPFVRLHRRDENASGDVAPLLALLRQLQRSYQLAVIVVHHAKKGGARTRAGQALRGSSEFHAWGDSMLYLRRTGERLTLSVEHRAAQGIAALDLELHDGDGQLALRVAANTSPHVEPDNPNVTLSERIVDFIAAASKPIALGELREACRVRKATLCEALTQLSEQGVLRRGERGYQLTQSATASGSGSRHP